MDQVLTLIGNPTARVVTEEVVAGARRALENCGTRAGTLSWLDPGIACDLVFGHHDPTAAELAVREQLADAPIDLAVIPAAGRRKALLVADMDSTIITAETLDELAESVGLKAQVAAITERAMNGELDFAAALRARVAMLKDLPAKALDSVLQRVQLTAGALALVQTMRAHGAYTALVSGGLTHVTAYVQSACGFDEAAANRLVIENGRLTGAVAEPIFAKEGKLRTVERLAAERGLSLSSACAVGDGANDVPMLMAAGLGVAFRGKPSVRAAVPIKIDYGDLTALLYLQGYLRSEFFRG
jgi:phosphoserine phosphatase